MLTKIQTQMAKEIIKIKPQLTVFDNESARNAANEIEAIEDGNDLHFILKTYGGTLWDGWESCLALQNFKGHSIVDVPGVSASFGIAFMLYADEKICSDQAKFMFHAVGGESGKLLSESALDLYKMIAKVIDLDKFKEVTGKTLKEVMIPSNGERFDVWLNAKEAKKIKLVDKVYNIDPTIRLTAEADPVGYYQFVEFKENNVPRGTNINNKSQKMNKEQLKTEQPALYNEIYNAGVEEGKPLGVQANQQRVDAFLEFAEIDAELVAAKVKDPEATVDAAFLKEISAKAKANALGENLNNGSEKPLNSGQPKNEPKKNAKTVDLSVIPTDVRESKENEAKGLGFSELETKAMLEELASDYAQKK